jgi:hypothetical protein
MSALDSSATPATSTSACTRRSGRSRTACGCTPSVAAISSTTVTPMPAATPRASKRADSVTTGIASQPSAGESMPPVSAIETAISVCDVSHAAAIAYSGLAIRSTIRSATAKHTVAAASGISVHQPSHGPANTSPAAISANVRVRVGLIRRSMSTTRSRSASSRHSQEPGCPVLDIARQVGRRASDLERARQVIGRATTGSPCLGEIVGIWRVCSS